MTKAVKEKTPKITYYFGVGRRKCAVATCRLYLNGDGRLTINDKEVSEEKKDYLLPLILVGKDKEYNISIRVRGGGFSGQKQAIRLAVAKAIVAGNPELKSTLKKAGYLTTDSRVRERKKYGLKAARRAPQFAKR